MTVNCHHIMLSPCRVTSSLSGVAGRRAVAPAGGGSNGVVRVCRVTSSLSGVACRRAVAPAGGGFNGVCCSHFGSMNRRHLVTLLGII